MKNLLVRLALVCICSSLICLVFSGQSSAKIDPATCMGAWLFNEDGEDTVSDISGNENHGAIKGNPKWEKGKFGLGLRLDGQGDYVDCGDKDSLDVGTSDFSIVAWLQCDKYTPAGWRHDIVNKLDTTEPRHGYTLSVRGIEDAANQEKPIVILGLGQGTGQHMFGKSSIADDTWHHVALTADRDGLMILYRDGEIEVQASIAAGANSDESNAMSFNIGAQGGSQIIQALIDEVAIFNVAFSQDEVKDIMANGLESALGLIAVSARGKLAATWAGIKDNPLPY